MEHRGAREYKAWMSSDVRAPQVLDPQAHAALAASQPSPTAGRRIRRALRALAIVALLLVYALAFQGSRGLWESDEGRYSDIACEMLRSCDFVQPTFHHEVPH
jgi:hypothetical protein